MVFRQTEHGLLGHDLRLLRHEVCSLALGLLPRDKAPNLQVLDVFQPGSFSYHSVCGGVEHPPTALARLTRLTQLAELKLGQLPDQHHISCLSSLVNIQVLTSLQENLKCGRVREGDSDIG